MSMVRNLRTFPCVLFAHAKGLAAQFGASLHLIHVVEDPVVTGIFGLETYVPESPGVPDKLQQEAHTRLASTLSEGERSRFRATSEVLRGPVAVTIVKKADELGASLIVMGTHGRTGVSHALMGSVAERVVQHALCPVLTVHAMPGTVLVRASNWMEAMA
jgi:nucleotide-binding universal stress UspA family protein